MGFKAANRSSFAIGLTLILLLAAIIRLIWLWQYHGMPEWAQLTVDNYYHLHWAQDIAGGDITGDTTYFRAPFYVYCLAALYSLFGSSLWVARLFGFVVGLASVATTGLLGRRMFMPRVGLIAAALHALYPIAVYFESELLLDPLFLLLFELAVYRFVIWLDRGRPRDGLWTGLLIGLAAITRPTALVLVPIVLLMILLHRDRFRPVWRQIGLLAAGLVIVIAPITIRNLAVAGDPVLISSQGGINLYIGNNDAADGVSAVMPMPLGYDWEIHQVAWIAEKARGGRALKPGEVSSYWTTQALRWIGRNPGRFVKLYAVKLYRNIANREISNNRDLGWFFGHAPFLHYNPLSFGIVFALALLGVLAMVGSDRQVRLLVLIVLCYVVVSSLFFFNSRFRLPLLPFFFILAGLGVAVVFEAFRRSKGSVLLVAVVLAAGAAISFAPIAPLPAGVSPQALLAQAHYRYSAGDYRASMESAKEASQIDSTFPGVNLAIGNAALRLGQAEEAQAAYEREIALYPDRPRARANLASLALVDGQPMKAIESAQRAIHFRPWDETANRVLIRAFFSVESISESALIDHVRKAAERTDSDVYLLNEAAELFASRREFEPAEEFASIAVDAAAPPIETDDRAFRADFAYGPGDMRRQHARAAYQLGYIYGVTGVLSGSIEYSRRAIELDSSLARAYVNLVTGYLSTGRSAEADSVLTEALRRFPAFSPLRELQRRLHP